MDYEKEYNYYYDSYFKKIENRVKEYYQTNFDKIEEFGDAHNAVREWLEAFPDKKLDFKTDKNLLEILKIFDNKGLQHKLNQNRIDKNKNIIQLCNEVLINSIKPYAVEIYKKEPLKKYKLKNILIRIALLKVVEDINRLLQTHNAFFQMIYELNEFDKFMIAQCGRQQLEQTEVYKTLRQKKYPEHYTSNENDDLDLDEIIGIDEALGKKTLDMPQKLLLIERLIYDYSENWESIPNRRRARVVALIIDKSDENIRKKLDLMNKKPSQFSTKDKEDSELINQILSYLG